jgi:hypothetical protein
VGDRWTSSGRVWGWWGHEASYCAVPVFYRMNGKVVGLGSCMGTLVHPGAMIKVAVGQVLQLHVSVHGHFPYFPLPWSTAPGIVRLELTGDAATATYRAVAPGRAVLETIEPCPGRAETPTGIGQVPGPCPVLRIRVTPS